MSASWRFEMYCKINRGQVSCPLYRGSPLFGGSVIRSYTVFCFFLPRFLPKRALLEAARFMGVNRNMDSFKGRPKQD